MNVRRVQRVHDAAIRSRPHHDLSDKGSNEQAAHKQMNGERFAARGKRRSIGEELLTEHQRDLEMNGDVHQTE